MDRTPTTSARRKFMAVLSRSGGCADHDDEVWTPQKQRQCVMHDLRIVAAAAELYKATLAAPASPATQHKSHSSHPVSPRCVMATPAATPSSPRTDPGMHGEAALAAANASLK